MNYKMVGKITALILAIEAFFMLPAMIICFCDGDISAAVGFVWSIVIAMALCGILMLLCRGAKNGFYAREGLACVGIGWTVLGLVGALPFVISGEIPNYIDALFEIVSGFTTTGASILNNVGEQARGILFWRSFSHWLGGMGVLVFLLAVIPISGREDGYTMHLMRAESPGPDVGKIVPRIRSTALILYLLYIALTVLCIIFLLFGGLDWFSAVCLGVGTAGTGGFGILADSCASYSPYIQTVLAVFMLLFGVNFSCYYLLLLGKWKDVARDEELRMYVIFVASVIAVCVIGTRSMYSSFGESLRHSAFQVASLVSTSGFSTVDYEVWPGYVKAALLLCMVTGGCAGSTAGGFKMSRVLLLVKSGLRNLRKTIRPNKIETVRVNGKIISEKVLDNASSYLAIYMFIFIASVFLVSFDGFSVGSNVTAVLACFNNIGPGLEAFGPSMSFAAFSPFSKLILTFDMLAGRLELFPMLALFVPGTWKK